MSGLRRNVWARARALDVAADPTLSPRARRLAQRASAPLTVDDILAAPDWMTWEADTQGRLARLAGAAAVAPAWRGSIDGKVLRQAAEAIGEAALDALLAAPGPAAVIDDVAATAADPAALERLGRAALLGEIADRPGLAARLGEIVGAQPWREAAPAAAHARVLFAQLEAGA